MKVLLLSACALLLGTALVAACNPVDPIEALAPLSDECIPDGQCADGFVCVGTKCFLRAGESCNEDFAWQPCELTQGVCAPTERQCVNGQLEAVCPVANYGPDFQPLETACDSLDNDCDGFVDQARPVTVSGILPEGVNQRGSTTRVVPFGSGFLAVTASRITSFNLPNPNPTSAVRVRALDQRLQPRADSPELVLSSGNFLLPANRLQAVSSARGVFIFWSQVPIQGDTAQEQLRLARVDLGPLGAPVLGLPPRTPATPVQDPLMRLAVSADSQRVLLAWREAQLQGQLFSPEDLAPLSEPRQLSAPAGSDGETLVGSANVMDVSADGASGFVAAWSVASAASPPAPLTQAVRVARLSSTLERTGDVVGLAESSTQLNTLRVLGALGAAEQPTVAWVGIPSGSGTLSLRHARPFAAAPTPSAPRATGGSTSIELARGDAGASLLFYSRVSGFFPQVVTLFMRRVELDNATADRNLGAATSGEIAANAFPDILDMPWAITTAASTGGLQYLTACSL